MVARIVPWTSVNEAIVADVACTEPDVMVHVTINISTSSIVQLPKTIEILTYHRLTVRGYS